MLALVATTSAQQAKEYEWKAAMLLNITRYVTWPTSAYSGSDSVFIVGVVGDDPFGDTLDRAFKGQSVEGRRVVVKRYTWAQRFDEAHLLFVARTEAAQLSKMVSTIRKKPVVTVGDADGFAPAGGMIGFRSRNGRMEFDVNLRSAKACDVSISSKLLMLAKSVIDGRGGN